METVPQSMRGKYKIYAFGCENPPEFATVAQKQRFLFVAEDLFQEFSLFHVIRAHSGAADIHDSSAHSEFLSNIVGKASNVESRRHLTSNGEIGKLKLLELEGINAHLFWWYIYADALSG
jgi:hypothetical protein